MGNTAEWRAAWASAGLSARRKSWRNQWMAMGMKDGLRGFLYAGETVAIPAYFNAEVMIWWAEARPCQLSISTHLPGSSFL